MPWRKPGDRYVSDPVPTPADADAGQPPSLPETDPSNLPAPSEQQGSLAAEFERITRADTPGAPLARARHAVLLHLPHAHALLPSAPPCAAIRAVPQHGFAEKVLR